MKPVLFFSEDIKIDVHSSTVAEFVGKVVSIKEFASKFKGSLVGLYEHPDGELEVQIRDNSKPVPEFIQGEQA